MVLGNMEDINKWAKKHPSWCKYPVTGKGHPIVDACWKYLSDRNINKKDCNGCEYLNKEFK